MAEGVTAVTNQTSAFVEQDDEDQGQMDQEGTRTRRSDGTRK